MPTKKHHIAYTATIVDCGYRPNGRAIYTTSNWSNVTCERCKAKQRVACDGCHEDFHPEDLQSVCIARQTHFDPPEYADLCYPCWSGRSRKVTRDEALDHQGIDRPEDDPDFDSDRPF